MNLSDERGVLVSWLVRLVIGLAIAGVILFEAGAIAVNTFTLSSTASDIAVALSTSAAQSGGNPSDSQLEIEARDLAKEAGAKVVSIELDRNARVVHVTLRRRADTLLIQHFDAISGWGRATAEGQAGYQ